MAITRTSFFPDATPGTTTSDGEVRRGNALSEDWSVIRGGVGTSVDADGLGDAPRITSDTITDKWESIARGIFMFDTSAIPDTDFVGGAILRIVLTGSQSNQIAQDWDIVRYTGSSTTALVVGDYDISNYDTTLLARILGSGSDFAGRHFFRLNSDGLSIISVTGITKLATMASGDRTDTEPSWAGNVSFNRRMRFANSIGTFEDPSLIVIHHSAVLGGDGFFSDQDPETTSVDGRVSRQAVDESFSSIRGGAGTSQNSTGTALNSVLNASATTDQYDSLDRAITMFDTSLIDSGEDILSGDYQMHYTIFFEALGSTTLDLVKYTGSSTTSLVNGDFDISNWDTTLQSDTQVSTSGSTGLKTYPLNATGIASIVKTGLTKFGVMIGFDRTNTEPTWASGALTGAAARSADDASELAGEQIPYLFTENLLVLTVTRTLRIGE